MSHWDASKVVEGVRDAQYLKAHESVYSQSSPVPSTSGSPNKSTTTPLWYSSIASSPFWEISLVPSAV